MNAPEQVKVADPITEEMLAALELQRTDYLNEGEVSAEVRIDRINRAIDGLLKYQDEISEALNKDFTCRPREINMLTDVAGSIGTLKHAKKHLRKWMKADKRPTMFPLGLLGGRSWIE